ncbi:hypothetical protein NDU88_003357, partial [Pleurodeles waltl]
TRPPRDAVSADYVPKRLLQQRRVAGGTGLPSRLFPHLGLHKRRAPRGTRFQQATSPSASCSSVVLPGEQDFPPGSFLTWGYIRDPPPRDAVSADYVPQRLLQQRRVAGGTGLPSRLFPHLGLHKRRDPRGTRDACRMCLGVCPGEDRAKTGPSSPD